MTSKESSVLCRPTVADDGLTTNRPLFCVSTEAVHLFEAQLHSHTQHPEGTSSAPPPPLGLCTTSTDSNRPPSEGLPRAQWMPSPPRLPPHDGPWGMLSPDGANRGSSCEALSRGLPPRRCPPIEPLAIESQDDRTSCSLRRRSLVDRPPRSQPLG